MRITNIEKKSIVDSVKKKDPDAKVYLYGSRVNDSAKGGDIDLLVKSELIGVAEKVDLLIEIKNHIGEQKIDLKIYKQDQSDAFLESVRPELVELV